MVDYHFLRVTVPLLEIFRLHITRIYSSIKQNHQKGENPVPHFFSTF